MRLTKGTFVSIKSIEVGFLGFLWPAAFIIKTLRPQLSQKHFIWFSLTLTLKFPSINFFFINLNIHIVRQNTV